MSKNKYIKDLEEIKDIMSRSSRFISLSGMSGVFSGIIALAGAYVAYRTVLAYHFQIGYEGTTITTENLTDLLLIAVVTLILSVGTVIYFTTRETRKRKLKIWDLQTKRLLINLAIPLLAGGILCLMLLYKGYAEIVIPMTLVFYGLALVNTSKYTLRVIRGLGIIEIALGLTAIYFSEFALLFWSFGFGILHIVYGMVMHLKSDS
jgi:hypothetical protein